VTPIRRDPSGLSDEHEAEGTGPSRQRLPVMAETQHTLSVPSDFLAGMIAKTRSIQAKEGMVDPNSGSNPVDDGMIDVLQDDPSDLSREEVRQQIRDLGEREQAELVALMWIGRGDAEPAEWEETVKLARDLKDGPTPHYLLRHPLVAEHWLEGAEKLGIDLPFGDDT
jgi:hypothetical protein